MTIILFELFSGINPFPGRIEQIFEAKRIDTKPAVPSDFPAPLKELILQGWSKDPKERPQLDTFKLALNKVMGDDLQQSTSERDQLVALQTSTFKLEVEETEENKLALNKMLGDEENKGTSFAASRTRLETFMNSKEAKDQLKAFPTFKSNLGTETEEYNSADSLSGNKDNSPQVTSNVSRETPKWIRNLKTASSIRPQETEKEKEAEAKQISVDQTLPEENNFLSQTAENISFKVQNRISLFEDIFASNKLKKEIIKKQTVVEKLNKAQKIKQEALVSPPPPSLPTTPPPPSPPPQLNKAQEIKQEALLSPPPPSLPTTPPPPSPPPQLNKAQEIKQEALVSPPPPSPPINPRTPSPPSTSLTPPALPQVLQQPNHQQAPIKAQEAEQEHHNDVTCTENETGFKKKKFGVPHSATLIFVIFILM